MSSEAKEDGVEEQEEETDEREVRRSRKVATTSEASSCFLSLSRRSRIILFFEKGFLTAGWSSSSSVLVGFLSFSGSGCFAAPNGEKRSPEGIGSEASSWRRRDLMILQSEGGMGERFDCCCCCC